MSRSLAGQIALIPWILLGVVAALGVAAVVLGLSGGADLLIITFGAAVGLVFAVTGALVASRLPRNPIGWIFCAFALLAVLGSLGDAYIPYEGGLPNRAWVAWAYWSINSFTPALIALSFLLFPTGRLPSARWRPLMWTVLLVSVTHAASAALAPGALTETGYPLENPAGIEAAGWLRTLAEISMIVLTAPLMLLCAASLFLRLRRASGTERQQLKWFAYAAALLVLFVVADTTITIMGVGGRVIDAATFLIFAVVISCIPASMGIAILRYRLYDIDIIINRTLVYGSLTLMLALVYFGGVTVTQALFQTLTGQERLPQLVVVASTLVIAALFNPLRRRIQFFIDRRFYRRKYDARKTLETFSATLRDETDLKALNNDLVAVVRETMQPAHVSLWLRPDTPRKDEQAV